MKATGIYAVWFHGQGRRPRRPRCLYMGMDKAQAWGTYGAARLHMERGRIAISRDGREERAERRGAR